MPPDPPRDPAARNVLPYGRPEDAGASRTPGLDFTEFAVLAMTWSILGLVAAIGAATAFGLHKWAYGLIATTVAVALAALAMRNIVGAFRAVFDRRRARGSAVDDQRC